MRLLKLWRFRCGFVEKSIYRSVDGDMASDAPATEMRRHRLKAPLALGKASSILARAPELMPKKGFVTAK